MVLRALLSAILFCTGSLAFADDEDGPRRVFGSHPGYLFNVDEEKTKRDIEMVMLDKPKPLPEKKAVVLVDEKLTKEFQQQYQYRFGTTAAEQVINNPSRDGDYTYYNNHSLTYQQYLGYQRDFGNYMIRRLVEYHVDNWFKNDPDLKPIYQAKDKLSNMNVEVKGGYKFKFKYSLSGPSLDATLENPYKVETRLQVLMKGLLTPRDEILSLGYNLNPRWKVETLYRTLEKLTQVVISRRLSKHTSVSVTGSSGLIQDTVIHQDLILFGIGWAE